MKPILLTHVFMRNTLLAFNNSIFSAIFRICFSSSTEGIRLPKQPTAHSCEMSFSISLQSNFNIFVFAYVLQKCGATVISPRHFSAPRPTKIIQAKKIHKQSTIKSWQLFGHLIIYQSNSGGHLIPAVLMRNLNVICVYVSLFTYTPTHINWIFTLLFS